jgi:exopolyphosphatase/guanosine-5'-triphosphate,3'-diphosphate pyrophosphatase
MLIADIDHQIGHRVRRDRAGTRLFAGLDAQRRLSPQSMKTSVDSVAAMAKSAREAGAEEVLLFATSATRDASNSDVFASLLRETSGLELQILPGESEAQLSFLGASGRGECGVIDIGGGSTEIIIGNGVNLSSSFSCQMGAVRLSRLYPLQSVSEMQTVINASVRILEEKLSTLPPLSPAPAWYGTGGTFTTQVAQSSKSINLFVLSLDKDFRFGIFNWENEITYQHSSKKEMVLKKKPIGCAVLLQMTSITNNI